MKRTRVLLTTVAVIVAAGAVGAGWMRVSHGQTYDSRDQYRWRYEQNGPFSRAGWLRANTPIEVRLDSKISTDDMRQGDAWSGRISHDVWSHRDLVIPAGAPVEGVVTLAAEGTHESQAQLGLAVREVSLDGQWYPLRAETEPIVAGSHRAQKLGAIAGGALVGAIVGHGISHEHGGLIGGLLGGALGYGVTRHAFRTLELEPGTVISFTTTEELHAEL